MTTSKMAQSENGFGLALLRPLISWTGWLPALFLLAAAGTVKADDFTYAMNFDGTITITRYIGAGGAVVIPSVIDGKTVSSIGAWAFDHCTNLAAITVDGGNPAYSSVDGVLFNKTQTSLIQYPSGKIGSYTIPNTVATIGYKAFYNCSGLSSVTIPNSVAVVGSCAFQSCASLAGLAIPYSLTNIGSLAFDHCASLAAISVDVGNPAYSSVDGVLFSKDQSTLVQYPSGKSGGYTIPDSVSAIGDYAFQHCADLASVTIPNTVTAIGYKTFAFCTSLTSVMIPDSVAAIGDYAFQSCGSLAIITVDTGNSVYSSLSGVLFNKSQSMLIQYPLAKTGSYTIPNTVAVIGSCAFQSCAGLASVMIPYSVTSMENTFYDCTNLAAITVDTGNPVYSSVAGVLFNKAQSTLIQYPAAKAGSYAIPNSVATIGEKAFYNCAGLSSVTIPNSVVTIESYAFQSCAGLAGVTIPYSVTSIGGDIFTGCTNLAAITVDTGNPVYSSVAGVLFNKNQTMLIQYPTGKAGNYIVPNTVTAIVKSAFDYCASLTDVTIPYSVAGIVNCVFQSCTNLTNVTIPNTVISIGDYAFSSCPSLLSVTVGNSVISIGDRAFSLCASLTGIYFEGNAPSLGSSVFDADNNTTVYYLPGTTGWGQTFGGRPTALWSKGIGPIIEANGEAGEITINYPETLSVTVAMNAGNYAGVPVDWWLVALAGSAWYYLNSSIQWTQFDGNLSNCRPVYQGELFNLPTTEVLNISGLPVGPYTFWFAVDYPMDGILNAYGPILVDWVKVAVQ